ncbi:MAG TPA: TetR/AcrR family transcriptional regulator [Thermoanaerobaculia bacterium]|nr:TetR/AcrR family transcriptional regulator [Thermoanaerobaculia bacterium]
MGRTARVTRDQVLDAARETFVDRGFEGATLAAIAAKIGVSPAALLRHARTKRDLFVACMGPEKDDLLPLGFLEGESGAEDPVPVLRRVAETMVPFLKEKLRATVARFVYFKAVAGVGRIPLPFDPQVRPTPPQRNLRLLEAYFRRAVRHGRLRISNPRAAALSFLATLHSYVFMQEVMHVLEKPLPLSEYMDSVLEVWTRGAISARGRKTRAVHAAGTR